MAAYGLYTQIAANKIRSRALLACLFLLIYVCVFAGALLAETQLRGGQSAGYYLRAAGADLYKALPVATLAGAIWMLIAWRFNQGIIDLVTGGREVTRQEQPRLYNLLENLCISRGITMPKLKLIDAEALNAFASGLNPKQYSVTVTSGLLARLNDAEMEAVLGHELTHIRNGDVRLMVIVGIVAGVIGFFAELFFRLFFRAGLGGRRSSSRGEGRGGGAAIAFIIAIALLALAWLLSVLIRFALSRSREFLADAGAVELTRNPDALIAALRKIENRGELEGATSAVMEMCIDNPRQGFVDLFATHPSVQARVDALVKLAGGHDPGPMTTLAGDKDENA
ncbi:MAG: M48 family metallopeptidase [Desulfobulbus sp.]|nr:M48 family metallopeptidase [Desulfobulbus sp.]